MPKRLPPNNRPWPENMAFDFSLSPTITPTGAEGFIDGLATTERNKAFLLLRYREGKTYNEIADEYGLTATGVRLAVKSVIAGATKVMPQSAPTAIAPVTTPAAPLSTLRVATSDIALQSAATSPTASATTPPTAPVATPTAPVPPTPPVTIVVQDESTTARPLSINLAAVRRFLNLTPEEFARPMHIDSGESLITRLETGFSRPSTDILSLICEAWGINRSYLLTGTGEMFEETNGYSDALVCLLRRYLAVATIDRQGQQFWKGALVDDLGKIIDVGRLDAPGMCRVVRVIYDYLDVDAFEALLDRMGRG